MFSRVVWTAGWLAFGAVMPGAPAFAADLGAYPRYGYNDTERYYDDRYGDRHSEPPYYDRRAEPPRGSWKDDDAPNYAAPYQPRGSSSSCLLNGEVRSHLVRQGWTDFRGIELHRNVAILAARRPDGLLYRLQVDRCSGVIVSAVLIEDRPSYPPRGYYGPRTYLPSY